MKKSTPDRCPTCGQRVKGKRSRDISDHFHGHVTQAARDTGLSRKYVYHMALLLAVEIEVDGGSPYPHAIVDDQVCPDSTGDCTNKEVMTAVEAIHMLAATWGVYLREKPISEQ